MKRLATLALLACVCTPALAEEPLIQFESAEGPTRSISTTEDGRTVIDMGGGSRIVLPRRNRAARDVTIRRAPDGGIDVSDPNEGRLHLAPGNGVSTLETPDGRYTIDNEILRELNGGRDLWDDIRSQGLDTGLEPAPTRAAQTEQKADGTTIVTLPDGRTVIVTADGKAHVIPAK